MYAAKILADSVSPDGEHRLMTMEATYPLIVHAEHLRHRDFSFSVKSNRAIPTKRIIEEVMNDPFIPEQWPINQKGMQAQEFYEEGTKEYRRATQIWLEARDNAVQSVKCITEGDVVFGNLKVHKQIANRLLSPFQWVTLVVSGTRWSNFFALRCHPAAQPEIRKIAEMMKELYENHQPEQLSPYEWHLPYVSYDELRSLPFGSAVETAKKISAARCARVSYLKHPTDDAPATPASIEEDIALADKLSQLGHWSPMEHVATPDNNPEKWSNFHGWRQWRKDFPNEVL